MVTQKFSYQAANTWFLLVFHGLKSSKQLLM